MDVMQPKTQLLNYINPSKVGSLKRHQRLGGGLFEPPLWILPVGLFLQFFFIPSLKHVYKWGTHAKNWVISFYILDVVAP